KKKINIIQILRFFSQIVFLILLPGLFTLAFSQLKIVYLMFMKGDFNFIKAFPNLIEVVTTLLITILLGRFFCGWMCAFGTFNDFIYMISKNVFKVKFKMNAKVDSILKYFKYVILLFIVYFMWTVGSKLFDNSSPWDAFAQIPQFSQAVPDYALGFLILVFIIIGAIFIERFFCRYLCPLGAVFAITSKMRLFKIDKPSAKCGECRICTKNCPMGIKLYKNEKVNNGECINCLRCTEVCPRKNAQASFGNTKINSTLASTVAVAAFVGLYSVNNVLGGAINSGDSVSQSLPNNKTKSTSTKSSSKSNTISTKNPSNTNKVDSTSTPSNSKTSKYKNGTYIGVGQGFRPGLTVSVEIKNDKITNIQIVSINDTPRYYTEPQNIIPSEIIQAQSTKVDAVSGATRSSNGIMMAVEDALIQAN
ncbi:MAG: 4Fe-4S binding protein, partial [Clostridiaceae bacterium]|nr:4Fe-4S binding protein [Clostridiaceae bacterium]